MVKGWKTHAHCLFWKYVSAKNFLAGDRRIQLFNNFLNFLIATEIGAPNEMQCAGV